MIFFIFIERIDFYSRNMHLYKFLNRHQHARASVFFCDSFDHETSVRKNYYDFSM